MKPCSALQDGYEAILNYLDSSGITEASKRRYKKLFEDIADYYETSQAPSYSPAMNAAYRDVLLARLQNGDIGKKKYTRCSRVSYMLDSYYAGEHFALVYSGGRRYKVQLCEHFQAQVDGFKAFLTGKLSVNSIPDYISTARSFFYYLQEQGLYDFRHLNDATVIGFLVSCHEYRPASMNNVCCAVRKILEYLRSYGCAVPIETVSYKAAPRRRKIYAALNSEELENILDVPGRDTSMGKRDYAILLLASFTGLRAIDIANLRFDNYEPEQKTIHLNQHKTGNLIGLPIPAEVVEAVNDYIQNGRPNVDNDYIFLTINRPYRKLSDLSSIRAILIRQLRNSPNGYSPRTGRGFHAFRRTMGKWLLEASVNPDVISQVLGHRDREVLKRYLPLAPDEMRKCALDFETVPLRSEVFV